ncbi:hypothetical protein [Streptomyces lydicus]|uniref:hypothetical protein n=1 Tax=Streptomyces lydicus TaxID=47763 RepID=UPI00372018A6
MSDTTTDSTSEQNPTPGPLTEAQAAVYTELVGLTDPATVIEIACAADVGKSTAGRALPMLEERGLAVRAPGGHSGPRRNPDLWSAAVPSEAPSTPASDDAPALAQSEPCTGDITETTSSSTEDDDSSREQPTPEITAPDTDSTGTCAERPANAAQSDPPQDTAERDDGDDTSQDGTHSEENSSNALAPQEDPEPTTAPAPPAPGAEGRLAPGALRQMVIDHLRAHPAEAFTATRISRTIERSSGAIANALDKLVSQGIAKQVNDRPREFRLADLSVNNE